MHLNICWISQQAAVMCAQGWSVWVLEVLQPGGNEQAVAFTSLALERLTLSKSVGWGGGRVGMVPPRPVICWAGISVCSTPPKRASLVRNVFCVVSPPMKGWLVGVWEDRESVLQQDHHTRHWQEQEPFWRRKFKSGTQKSFWFFVFFTFCLCFLFCKEIWFTSWKSCEGHTGSLGDVPGSEYFLLLRPLPSRTLPPIASTLRSWGWGGEVSPRRSVIGP